MRVVEAMALVAVLCVGACKSNSKASDAKACEADLKTLRTAEEAYHAANNTYGTYEQLITAGFASDSGTNVLHTVALSGDGTSYALPGTKNCPANYTSAPN